LAAFVASIARCAATPPRAVSPAELSAWPEFRLWAAAPPVIAAWLEPASPFRTTTSAGGELDAAANDARVGLPPLPPDILAAAVAYDQVGHTAPTAPESASGGSSGAAAAARDRGGHVYMDRSTLLVPVHLDVATGLLAVAAYTERHLPMADLAALAAVAPLPAFMRGVFDTANQEGLLLGVHPSGAVVTAWSATAPRERVLSSFSVFGRPLAGAAGAAGDTMLRSGRRVVRQKADAAPCGGAADSARPAAAGRAGTGAVAVPCHLSAAHAAVAAFRTSLAGTFGSAHVPSPMLGAAAAPPSAADMAAGATVDGAAPSSAATLRRLLQVAAGHLGVVPPLVEEDGGGGRLSALPSGGGSAPPMVAAPWTDMSLDRERSPSPVRRCSSEGVAARYPCPVEGCGKFFTRPYNRKIVCAFGGGRGEGGRAIGRTSAWPNRRPEWGVQAGRFSTGGGSLQRRLHLFCGLPTPPSAGVRHGY